MVYYSKMKLCLPRGHFASRRPLSDADAVDGHELGAVLCEANWEVQTSKPPRPRNTIIVII